MIPANPEVLQNLLKSSYICGIRGGDPFVSVKRPLLETGECPSGTKPCSRNTTPDNTVCYPEEEHEAKCPITKILVESYEMVAFLRYKEDENGVPYWEFPFEWW